MNIKRTKDEIIIKNQEDFNVKELLECGQVFSYEKINEDYVVISLDKFAVVSIKDDYTVIKSKDIDYFYNYFDLDTDYNKIKKRLCEIYPDFNKFFVKGLGIRILRQDEYQTIISFIVSQNNNIKRIHKILKRISEEFGHKLDCGFFSFPSCLELSRASEEDFKRLGTGYRSKYLFNTIKQLQEKEYNIESLRKLDTRDLRKKLLNLCGVGPKVADCILFFGFNRTDVFPVDTWIKKAYETLFSSQKRNEEQISQFFISTFGSLSGYAQQYIFNYMITNK